MPKSPKVKEVPTRMLRLEAFDIQGHNGDKPLDYVAFFTFIANLGRMRRQEQVADRLIAVPRFENIGGLISFSAYVGSPGSSVLLLDMSDGSEEVTPIASGKLLATRTLGVIDPIRRVAIIQYVHTGVRAQQIAALLEKLAHRESTDFTGATLEFALRVGATFRDEVLRLSRIQSVSMTLTRPNYDWLDYSNTLTGLAQDSNAHNVSVAASATRSQSLSKTTGVVRLLSHLISGTARSILKSASVDGNRESDDQLITLKLNKMIEAKNVKVEVTDGMPATGAVNNAARDFLANLNGDQ